MRDYLQGLRMLQCHALQPDSHGYLSAPSALTYTDDKLHFVVGGGWFVVLYLCFFQNPGGCAITSSPSINVLIPTRRLQPFAFQL